VNILVYISTDKILSPNLGYSMTNILDKFNLTDRMAVVTGVVARGDDEPTSTFRDGIRALEMAMEARA